MLTDHSRGHDKDRVCRHAERLANPQSSVMRIPQALFTGASVGYAAVDHNSLDDWAALHELPIIEDRSGLKSVLGEHGRRRARHFGRDQSQIQGTISFDPTRNA
jgi:hypothetical protein